MGVAAFIASRLDPEETEEEDGPSGIRVTIRLDAEYAAKLDEGAEYLSMKRTGCATQLLKAGIDEMVSNLLNRDPEWINKLGPAVDDANQGYTYQKSLIPPPGVPPVVLRPSGVVEGITPLATLLGGPPGAVDEIPPVLAPLPPRSRSGGR